MERTVGGRPGRFGVDLADFGVLVPIAHREQPQNRESVRHGQVGQS
jgi:hypothetical protein